MKFLHRADLRAGQAQWVTTSAARLRDATFLDGRERFWDRDYVVEQDFAPSTAPFSPNFLFHFGFCGSTLLAKLIDTPGTALALKEPQALTDIASQQSALRRDDRDRDTAEGLEFALQSLTRLSDETLLIKPSNWANGLLPLLSRRNTAGRALFLSIDQRAFLLATFRGGRDRLAFCARLAAVLADSLTDGQALLQRAIDQTSDPLGQAAMLSAFAYNAQAALFDDAISTGQWDNTVSLGYQELVDDLPGAVQRSREFLGLPAGDPLDPALITRHAKDGAQKFSQTKQQKQNAELEALYGERCSRAAEWANQQQFSVALQG